MWRFYRKTEDSLSSSAMRSLRAFVVTIARSICWGEVSPGNGRLILSSDMARTHGKGACSPLPSDWHPIPRISGLSFTGGSPKPLSDQRYRFNLFESYPSCTQRATCVCRSPLRHAKNYGQRNWTNCFSGVTSDSE